MIANIKDQKILPLYYHHDATVCVELCTALYNAGIRCVEFTNRGPNARDNFKKLVNFKSSGMKDLHIGVGTVKSAEEAGYFLSEGADFLVSPIFMEEIAALSAKNDCLWIPGCMTPTEIAMAENAGCRLIKLFPGSVLGTGFLEAIKPLFRDIDFIVTGGVHNSEASLKTWFNAGVAGVGMGSALISNDIVENRQFEKLTIATKKVMDTINQIP